MKNSYSTELFLVKSRQDWLFTQPSSTEFNTANDNATRCQDRFNKNQTDILVIMCWYVEFSVRMAKDLEEKITNVETVISGFSVLPGKKAMREVQFVKGSVADGYRTALHCDCDYVKGQEGDNQKILNYPELFKLIMEQPGVKNIKVHWYWSDDEDKAVEENISISEFLKKNDESKLRSKTAYKILKDSYY
jgi:hypothetical protein